MSLINRGSLPQNYVDFASSTTTRMRLPTPDAQFLFAPDRVEACNLEGPNSIDWSASIA